MSDSGRVPTATSRRSHRPTVTWDQVRKPAVVLIALASMVFSTFWQAALADMPTRDAFIATGWLTLFGAIVVGSAISRDAARNRR